MGERTRLVDGSEQSPSTFSRRRLLIEMTTITLFMGVSGQMAASGRFFAGALFGGAVSIINFLWLDRSTAKLFKAVAEGGKPGLPAIGYILRYFLIGLILFGVYLTAALPMLAVILGLASFAFAVVLEGIINIFRNL